VAWQGTDDNPGINPRALAELFRIKNEREVPGVITVQVGEDDDDHDDDDDDESNGDLPRSGAGPVGQASSSSLSS
jgi:hypothetical protein